MLMHDYVISKLIRARPWPVKRAFFADALKAMRTKEITLRLDEIGGATPLAVSIKITQCIRECRGRRANQRCLSDDSSK